MYATLYNDEADIRVYGAGPTEEASEGDAQKTVRELGWAWENYYTVEVTAEQFSRIAAGDVDARSLRIEYRHCRHQLGL